MKASQFKGVALTATYEQIDKLLYLVENVSGYRDWDWLNYWLTGGSMQVLTPDEVIQIYASDTYWRAVEQGDVAQTESIRRAILGLD